MQIKLNSTGAVLLLASLLLVACSRPAPPEDPIRAVRTMTVEVGSFESSLEFAGDVRARVESRLGFRVAGKIVQRPVEVGQRVKAGKLLAQLDPQDYKLAAEAARSQVSMAATNRNQALAEFNRYKELKDQNFISGVELERRETAWKSAEAQLEQAQSQLSSLRNQAAYTNLMSDLSGVVLSVEAEPGQVVAAGSPIVRIANDGPRDVVFVVPEDRVAMIKVGSAVKVRAWTKGAQLTGRVREVAASADPVTRTFQVKVALGSADALPLGTTVYVQPDALSLTGAPVIKIPTSALKKDGQTAAVWLVDKASMTVRTQPVQLATADGNEIVIAGGLEPGMVLVTAGVHVLSEGQKVSFYQEKPAAQSSTSGATVTSAVPAASAAAAPSVPQPVAPPKAEVAASAGK